MNPQPNQVLAAGKGGGEGEVVQPAAYQAAIPLAGQSLQLAGHWCPHRQGPGWASPSSC